MDIIEESKLELELTSKLIAYTEFILDFKKENSDIYCFYEGKEDRNYYSIRINLCSKSAQQKFHYTCNGKDNVLKLENLLSKHSAYSNSNLLFFVDSDFDENDKISDNIYITKFYGIENFYTVDESFKNILINEYQIPVQNENFLKATSLFKQSKRDFHNKILNLNTWLACQADYRRNNNISTRLNIDNSLRKFYSNDIFEGLVNVDFSISLPNDIGNLTKYRTIFPDAPIITNDEFNSKLEIIKTTNFEEAFRGKFELKFLISFLKRFQEEITKKTSILFTKKFTCNLRFEHATCISQMTNNAITHDCLREYIQYYSHKKAI